METQRVFLVLVDSSDEMQVALKFACLRANSIGGRVALVYILDDSSHGENWLSVSGLARQEARTDAERILEICSAKVNRWTGNIPSIFIREGAIAEEFATLIQEEYSISIAVLGASAKQANPGPVISYLMSKGVGNLRIPITIVPGNAEDRELEALT